MNVICTICSANYLATAITLWESVTATNPEVRFSVCLVDRRPEMARPIPAGCEVVPVEEIGLEALLEMAGRYNTVELNTAVKPFFLEYLYGRDAGVEKVVYLDPDMVVCDDLGDLFDLLTTNHLVVTPHGLTGTKSEISLQTELAMLATGIYNLGFLGTARCAETFTFLEWWGNRLRKYCYYHGHYGLFVDQIWAVLAPIFFPGTLVLKDVGYNVAYWNLYERDISEKNGTLMVNQTNRLKIYHFSSYNPAKPELISTRLAGVAMKEFPILEEFFGKYRKSLLQNGHDDWQKFAPYFQGVYERVKVISSSPKKNVGRFKKPLRALLKLPPPPFRRWMNRVASAVAEACA